MLNEDDIKSAWEKLTKGRSLDTVAMFYGISKEELKTILKKYYNIGEGETITGRIKAGKVIKKKPNDSVVIRVANEYKEMGRSYDEFLKIMKESGREFSGEIIDKIRHIFNSESEPEVEHSKNDEIEI